MSNTTPVIKLSPSAKAFVPKQAHSSTLPQDLPKPDPTIKVGDHILKH